MCGIFGLVGDYKKSITENCINSISHRGPDNIGLSFLNGVALAHARLTILDTDTRANQPMTCCGGRYVITYNGEIYNFLEIKAELIGLGYTFCTESDTEIIPAAYHAWGTNFLKRLNGMWAMAIWDKKKDELFLARDRFGIKPLYYMTSDKDGYFSFASEMKAFFPLMEKIEINRKLVAKRDYFSYEATGECVINGIERFPAGYYGIYGNGHLHLEKWWDTKESLIQVSDSYKEQVSHFRDLFLDACRIRMRSDVPIGTALSGGLDSSSCVAAMNYISKTSGERITDNWKNFFVASLPGTTYDETLYACKVGKYVGKETKKAAINPQISEDELLDYLYVCEEPYATSPVPFIQTYKKISDAGIKVTIDGHGADEIFGGYSFDIPYAAIKAYFENDEEELEYYRQVYNNSYTVSYMRKDKENFCKLVKYAAKTACANDDETRDYFNEQLYKEVHETILPNILRTYDRYSMANGVEIRMPFLDYRIVSFALSIPASSKIKNGYTKSIIRDAIRGLMDEDIINRKGKIGFNTPSSEWMRGMWREFISDIIYSDGFKNCDTVNSDTVKKDFLQLLDGSDNNFPLADRVWCGMVPYLWELALKRKYGLKVI